MFYNYIIVALRNLARHRLYSIITIAGLTVGLACALFIILFVRDETSYDRWVPDTASLYRLELTINAPGRPRQDFAPVPFPLAKEIQAQIPGVTAFTRSVDEWSTITLGAKQFVEEMRAVDPNFFEVMHFPLVTGTPAQVLANPESIVLSQTTARKYFGNANALGKTLRLSKQHCDNGTTQCLGDTYPMTVTGVFRDLPANSQFSANIIFPNTSQADGFAIEDKTSWTENNAIAYLRLAPGTRPADVLARTPDVLDKGVGTALVKLDPRLTGHVVYTVHLTPFRAVHLASAHVIGNLTPAGSWTTVYGVIAIGVLIMLMACFNFMNLSTARAMLRAREIAVRKALGARRGQIIVQFLGEAVLIALLAMVLAMALVDMLVPAFGAFIQKPIVFDYLADWPLVGLILAVAVGAGLFSGIYPALVLSAFRPAAVLRGGGRQARGGWLRSVLVVSQFTVSIALGITTLVIFSQINHARKLDLGLRHDNTVLVYTSTLSIAARESFRRELLRQPGVEAVAESNDVPFSDNQSITIAKVPGQSSGQTLNIINVSPSYRDLYGIALLAGRDLLRDRAEDIYKPDWVTTAAETGINEGHHILLNAAAARQLGFSPQQAANQRVDLNGSHVIIAGVVADVKFKGAREPVKPMAFYYYPYYAQTLSVRVKEGAMRDTLDHIDRVWHSFSANNAVSRNFLDDKFAAQFRADERQGQMFGIFVGLAIFIACLGLFGLAAFTAGRRTREIGIRKVFGASTRDVIFMLLWQSSIPVVVANVIAWPLAWIYLRGWLDSFAFRIDLSPLYFVSVGAAALLIAWATTFAHTFKVARANPVKALRSE
jgi:putative ABC transport system permease protein